MPFKNHAQSYRANLLVGDQQYPAYQLRNLLQYIETNFGEAVAMQLCGQIGVGHQELKHQQYIYVWQADFAMAFLCNISDDPQVGAKVGSQYDVADLGFLLNHFRLCETIGECLQFVISHPERVGSFTDTLVSKKGNILTIRWLNTGKIDPQRYSCQFQHSLCGLLNVGSKLAGKRLKFSEVHLTESFEHADFIEDFTSAKVSFGADFNQWSIDLSYLNWPVVYPFETESIKAASELSSSYIELQLEQLRLAFPDFPNMEQMAQLQNMSARTYRRKLSQAGSSYQKLLDQVRCQSAIGLILSQKNTIDEISEVMGFSDTSHFRQSFKHWLGHPPGHFLRLNEQGDSAE